MTKNKKIEIQPIKPIFFIFIFFHLCLSCDMIMI